MSNNQEEKNGRKEKTKMNKGVVKFRKAPQAPKRAKSAFILFSKEVHRKIRAALQGNEVEEKVKLLLIKDKASVVFFIVSFRKYTMSNLLNSRNSCDVRQMKHFRSCVLVPILLPCS